MIAPTRAQAGGPDGRDGDGSGGRDGSESVHGSGGFDATDEEDPAKGVAGAVGRFDRWVDQRVAERLRGRRVADRVFYAASALGDHGLVWMILASVQAVLGRDRWRAWLRTIGALGAESVVVNGPVKFLFRRQRPVHHEDAPLPVRVPITSSFPSGHASSAFCAAALLSQVDPPRRKLYYALAVVVAWSRVHVRLHHASDVIGGAAAGTVLGQAVKRFVPLNRPRR